ncbi:MAG: lytic transglycosylase domain-containing protein [Bacteroidetes bacterium]|nr:lytic transglycosylase domain-containing protein [Bacteroidota bacterium]
MTKTIIKKILYFGFPVMILLAAGLIFIFSHHDGTSDVAYWNAFTRNNRILSPPVPDSLVFAGEPVPLDLFYVREALDRELIVNTYWHSSTLFMFKRAHRYLPVIEPILKKYGIPDDFKYVAMIESGLRNVISPTGATGFWQFLSTTGNEYGLEINTEVDERYHIEKSTEAACRYFRDAYSIFQNWTLAAASYNAGIQQISEILDKQKATSYYDLLLSEETSRYIYRILAIKNIYSYPTHYGYFLRVKDFYPAIPTDTMAINKPVDDLAQFAKKQNISYLALKELNPWLRQNYLKNRQNKTYIIHLPKDGFLNYSKLLENNDFEEDAIFGDTLKVIDLI